jgi:hypothetical protein
MKHVAIFALAVVCSVAPVRAAADGTAALERLEGTWESSATAADTPYSKAGASTAHTSCTWDPSHEFLICRQSVVTGGATTNSVAVYTFDAAGQRYHFYAARTNGVSDVGITVDTTGIMYTTTFADAGKNVTIRTLNVWDDADHYHFWTEYTTDASHWTKMLVGTARRAPSQP